MGLLISIVLLASCATAEQLWNQYQQGGNNKAYATGAAKGGVRVVGAAWNYPTANQAIEAALNFCADAGGDNCQVTHLNGATYSGYIPQNSFKKITGPDIFSKEWARYKAGSIHKAFAYDGSGAIGVAQSNTTATGAIEEALRACRLAGGKDCQVMEVDGKSYDQ